MTTISSGVSGMSNWGGMPPRMEGKGGKPSFSSIDTDSSGGLNKTEWQSMLEKGPQGVQGAQGSGTSVDDLFSKLDSDGDGSVTESELDKGMKPPGRDGQGGQNAFGGMGMDTQGFASVMGAGMMNGMGGGMPPPPPPDGGLSSLNQLDSDDDGSITLAEFGLSDNSSTSETTGTNDAQQALFDMMDEDQSGDISKAELNTFQDKMKALFEKMQQMGAMQFDTTSSSISLSA